MAVGCLIECVSESPLSVVTGYLVECASRYWELSGRNEDGLEENG